MPRNLFKSYANKGGEGTDLLLFLLQLLLLLPLDLILLLLLLLPSKELLVLLLLLLLGLLLGLGLFSLDITFEFGAIFLLLDLGSQKAPLFKTCYLIYKDFLRWSI